MPHFLTSDDKYRDLIHGDDHRSYLINRSNSPGSYKFGRILGNRAQVRAPNSFGRVKGNFKRMIEAIANAKLRRMERELELRGVRMDQATDTWAVRKSRSAEQS